MSNHLHKSPEMLNFILVEHELGASLSGSRKGPQTVLEQLQSKFPQFQKSAIHKIDQGPTDALTPHAKNLMSTYKTMVEVRNLTTKSLRKNRFPVVFSGDHSTAVGTIAGIRRAFQTLRIGVVWFDAHTDIHSPMTSHSANLHGMPMSAATGQNNLAHERQKLTASEAKIWQETQKLGGTVPMVDLKDVAFVGIRDVEKEEKALVEKAGCLLLDAQNVKQHSAEEIVSQIKSHLKDCDVVYISFDIDCLDKALVPGTGTPVSDGPEPEKILSIMTELSAWERIVCFEMSEVNPSLDEDGKTSAIAAQIVHQILQ